MFRRQFLLASLVCLHTAPLFAQPCPSVVTLNIQSSNYSGKIDIELREGSRPGSKLLKAGNVESAGTLKFEQVCAGRYFFAFATPDAAAVSVTSYFDVVNDGQRYSNPVLTVTYSRSTDANTQRVGSARRQDL